MRGMVCTGVGGVGDVRRAAALTRTPFGVMHKRNPIWRLARGQPARKGPRWDKKSLVLASADAFMEVRCPTWTPKGADIGSCFAPDGARNRWYWRRPTNLSMYAAPLGRQKGSILGPDLLQVGQPIIYTAVGRRVYRCTLPHLGSKRNQY